MSAERRTRRRLSAVLLERLGAPFRYVLGLLMLALLAPSTLEASLALRFAMLAVILLGLVVGVQAAGAHRRVVLAARILAGLVLVLEALVVAVDELSAYLLQRSVIELLLVLSILAILRGVLRPTRVDSEKILAALSVFLLIGIAWSYLYASLDRVVADPPAFSIAARVFADPIETEAVRFEELGYFSFTTLTTLGYGDIVPVNPLVRRLATIEALVGQAFLAVLIARLVGMHVAHGMADRPQA